MQALLALIPLKDWVYGSIIAALLVAFGVYTVHERHEGAAKVVAAAVKAVDKANAVVVKDDATAATTENQNAIIYKQAVSIPAIGDLGVVCQRTASRSVSLSAAGPVETAGPRNDSPVSTVGPVFDPSGAILTRGREADAEITYLQKRVAELEKQMNDAP